MSYTPTMFLSILPEILLLVLGVLLLVIEPFWKGEKHRNAGWLTAGGLLAIMAISLFAGRPGEPTSVFGGMLRYDWLGFFFKMLFIFGAAVTSLFMMDHEILGKRGESFILLIAATLGMNLMAASADLVMLYLAIETTSIPLYVLAGFMLSDKQSTEAGFKYLLFGAMTSAIMLYGFSLLFGFAGTTNLYELASMAVAGQLSLGVALGLVVLIVVGLGFKVSIVPFHFWAPDVYTGAPTPVAGFLSTASKAAGFAVVLRLFMTAFQGTDLTDLSYSWASILAVLSAITMTLGNLVALKQTNIKRLLAYSSIAHAGYAMIGVVAVSTLGVTSVIFYLLAYILTNLAAFGIVMAFERVTGSDEIKDYAGMSRRSPGLALAMLVAFLSLAGMPPFGGFVAKVFVFAAAVQVNMVWLAVVGILNSIVGLYYYLTVLKVVYLYRMEGEDEEVHPIPLTRPYVIGLVILTLGILLVGTLFAPWFGLSGAAALNLF
ncbi:MAG: NADH-quinone oxidoreductase subunit N [Anaerolineales bacterium]|nr:NADH-quinone oxidoreductase subunit N [Anaerolineales bacterium]